MRMITTSAALIFAVMTSSVFAQTAAPQAPAPAAATPAPQVSAPADPEAKARFEKFRLVCGADLQTHCANVQRGEQAKGEQGRGEMRQCIEANKAKFSTACQTAITERDAARQARKQGVAPAAAAKRH